MRKFYKQITIEKALDVFLQILDGVEAAHLQKVVHRDLKPENILVKSNLSSIVIADFGIAHFCEEEIYTAVETRDGTRLANFQYAAPEQKFRGGAISFGADIYALGLILNEIFTSKLAHGTNFEKIGDKYPEYSYLDPIVEKMLEQNPANRFPNIDEIKKAIITNSQMAVVRQKLARISQTVVPSTELDDPLIKDPVKIVNVDWENNNLRIRLNHKISHDWIQALNNMGSYSSVFMKGPEAFQFYDDIAVITSQEHEANAVLDHFKAWLPKANLVYERQQKQKQEMVEKRERDLLREKARQEEARLRVLKNLKF